MHKPESTKMAAYIFQSVIGSPKTSEEAVIPNTGTNKVKGAMVAAG
jgi:hypothetical protein